MIIDILVWTAYFLAIYSVIYWILLHLEGAAEKSRLPKKKTPKTWPTLTIIVPAYNEEKSLSGTLESIDELDYPKKKLQVIVINDGSKDDTAKIADQHAEKKKYIQVVHQKNIGKAKSLNKALAMTKTEFFACLDADSFVKKHTAKEMIKAFCADSELQICTPVMLIRNPQTFIQRFQRLEYLTAMLVVRLMAAIDANYVAPGPFSMYRTQTIKDLGGFAEDTLVEDQEIAYRVQEHHGKIRQIPKGDVETIGPNTFGKLRRQRNRWMKGSLQNLVKYRHLMFNKDYGDFGSFMMPLTLSSFFLAIVAIIAFAYYTLTPLISGLRNLWLVGFDIMPWLSNLTWNFSLLDPNYTNLWVIVLMTCVGLFLLYTSTRTYDESLRGYGSFYILPYFFVYFLMLAYFSTEVLIEYALGKKQKW